MWLFTRHGFFSIVRSHQTPSLLMIRARNRKHLVRLQSSLIGKDGAGALGEILETPDVDYRWRWIVEPQQAVAILAQLAREIDYPCFKSECQRALDDPIYQRKLHDVWGAMHHMQQVVEHQEAKHNV